MKIEKLILENFRGVSKTLELPLEPDLTVLAGVNGSGKSTVLDALAILLSWIIARVRRAGGSGQQIPELSIHKDAKYARISAVASATERLSWQLIKTKKGHAKPIYSSELDEVSRYAKHIQHHISDTQEACNIPIFSYYPINRAVLSIPLRIRASHNYSLFASWHNSLENSASFRQFFEWFRSREDLENEERLRYYDISESDVAAIKRYTIWQELARGEDDGQESGIFDVQLIAVRHALNRFLPTFSNFSVRRKPLRMIATKNNNIILIEQLSDGEKCLIAMVGDLARRLAIANPKRENPLEGEGVVLIDEIDLHLHPAWQRTVLTNLTRTFPNCQFVVSTHSPQVLGEAEPRQIRLLMSDADSGLRYVIPSQAKGLSSNDILDELMRDNSGTLTRNTAIQQELDQLSYLIDRENFQEAKNLIAKLKLELHGDRPELLSAESLLFMLDADGDL